MAFKFLKKDTWSKLGDIVRNTIYPIALRNKLEDTFTQPPLETTPPQQQQPLKEGDLGGSTVNNPPYVPSGEGDNPVKDMQSATIDLTQPPKKDLSGLQTIMGTQQDVDKWNKKVQKDYLDFLTYATKFGDVAKPYVELAGQYAQSKMKTLPKMENINPKELSKDSKTGEAFIMQWNPYSQTTVRKNLGVPYDELVVPEFNKDMLHFEQDKDGNAIIRNLQNGSTVSTGIPYSQFDANYDIKNRQLNLDEAYKMGMLNIKQAGLLTKGGSRKNGSGNSEGIPVENDGNLMVLDPNGNPMGIEEREDDKGNTVRYIAGTNIKYSDVDNQIEKLYGSKKEFAKGKGSLETQGFTITSKKNYIDNRRSYYTDYKRKLLSGEMTPQDFANIVEFDKKQGIISNAEYNYIKKNLTGQ